MFLVMMRLLISSFVVTSDRVKLELLLENLRDLSCVEVWHQFLNLGFGKTK